jgi:hypothetical protein
MKRLLTAAVLAAVAVPAGADVSEDLKFCGARKNAPERLACFEAVTRGTSKHGPTLPTARAVAPQDALAAIPTKAPPLDPPPVRNPFDGYYTAIGGGYGVGTRRDASLTGVYTQGFQDALSLPATTGASADFVIGRNIALSWGIVGIELDGRYGGEGGSSNAGTTPQFFSVFSGTGLSSYKYRNDASVHAAIRAGVVFDDLLIFAKAGVGASRVQETFTSDERGISLFICPDRNPFGFCTSSTTIPTLNSIKTTSWLPSAIFGVGVEKNWGPVFGRLGADFEAVNHPTTFLTAPGISGSSSSAGQLTWTARGTALIGVRF